MNGNQRIARDLFTAIGRLGDIKRGLAVVQQHWGNVYRVKRVYQQKVAPTIRSIRANGGKLDALPADNASLELKLQIDRALVRMALKPETSPEDMQEYLARASVEAKRAECSHLQEQINKIEQHL